MRSNNIASHRSTARGRGQVRRSLQSHTFLQASKFERKANRNEVFIANRDSRCLHYHFPLFYLQAASKTQAFDAAGPAIRCGVQAPVELTLKPALYSSSSQIHADSSSTTHTGTGRRSRPGVGLASPVFPNRTPCLPSQQTARGRRPRIKLRSPSTTWQLVVLVPGSTDTHVAKHMAISRNVTRHNRCG